MNPRIEVLKQLVTDELYVIDEAAVAEAVVLRATARRLLPGVTFTVCACDVPAAPVPRVKSFRPHRGARSFRLSRAQRRPLHARAGSLLLAR